MLSKVGKWIECPETLDIKRKNKIEINLQRKTRYLSMWQVYNNNNVLDLKSTIKWMNICQITMKILVNHSPMITWNKEQETMLVECNTIIPSGWKCNYYNNGNLRDDFNQLMQDPKANTNSWERGRDLKCGLYHLQMRKTNVILNPRAYGVNETPSMEAKGKRRLEYQTIILSTHKPRSNLLGRNPRVYPFINPRCCPSSSLVSSNDIRWKLG